jgi:hypothetical protein
LLALLGAHLIFHISRIRVKGVGLKVSVEKIKFCEQSAGQNPTKNTTHIFNACTPSWFSIEHIKA